MRAQMAIQLRPADLCAALSSWVSSHANSNQLGLPRLPTPFPQLKDIAKFPPGFPVLSWQLKTLSRQWTAAIIVLPLIVSPLSDYYPLLPNVPRLHTVIFCLVISYFRREGKSVPFHTFWNLAISHTHSVPTNIIEKTLENIFFSLKICRTLRIIPVYL